MCVKEKIEHILVLYVTGVDQALRERCGFAAATLNG